MVWLSGTLRHWRNPVNRFKGRAMEMKVNEIRELTDDELEVVNGGLLMGLLFKMNSAVVDYFFHRNDTVADWNDAH
jgi:hypothetical protein